MKKPTTWPWPQWPGFTPKPSDAGRKDATGEKTGPSDAESALAKVIHDKASTIDASTVKAALDERIRSFWKSGAMRVVLFPHEAADLSNDATEPVLAVIHYDDACVTVGRGWEAMPPNHVNMLCNRAQAPAAGRPRKEDIIFVVADKEKVERIKRLIGHYEALRQIIDDNDYMKTCSPESRGQLKEMLESDLRELKKIAPECYRHLYFFSPNATERTNFLAHLQLPVQDTEELAQDPTAVVLQCLRAAQ